MYTLIFYKYDLLLRSTPFNKPSRRSGDFFSSGIWTFPFWQNNENWTSFDVLLFSALSSYHSWAWEYWHSKQGSPILSSSEQKHKPLAHQLIFYVWNSVQFCVTLPCNSPLQYNSFVIVVLVLSPTILVKWKVINHLKKEFIDINKLAIQYLNYLHMLFLLNHHLLCLNNVVLLLFHHQDWICFEVIVWLEKDIWQLYC